MTDDLTFSPDESDEEYIEIKTHNGGLILKQENQIYMCKKYFYLILIFILLY